MEVNFNSGKRRKEKNCLDEAKPYLTSKGGEGANSL